MTHKMSALCDLLCAGLIEKDQHGDVLWTWSYPAVSSTQRSFLLDKCCLSAKGSDDLPLSLVYGQHRKQWYYIFSTVIQSSALPQVTHLALALFTRDFNPEKYHALCQILSRMYCKTGNPSNMLENYLSVVTKGVCNGEENGKFTVKDFDSRQAYAAVNLKGIINRFKIETILIYTAILLKKRVAVYHPQREELLLICRALPALVWHRQNWNILHPDVALVDSELQDLQGVSSYIAGCTDAAIETRTELYDLFVNASTNEIVVSPSAKETFAMGKLHKDIATVIVQSGQDEDKTQQQCIKEIAMKTKELLNNLKSLATAEESGKPCISLEALRQRNMPTATENFLFNLAAAEGWVKM